MFTRFLILNLIISTASVFGQIPTDYYSTANNKSGYELKTALYHIIKGHVDHGYSGLWDCYYDSDIKPNGKVWDMYSDVPSGTPAYEFTFGTDQCGSYSNEGDCYNREHLVPQSWFNEASPMKNDPFHVVPSDGKVNGQRGSYPFSEVSSATWMSTNGSKKGNSSFEGYSSTSFEPINEYKGDIARSLFYVATRYENVISGWVNNGTASAILDGSSNKVFKDWQLNLLLKWHQQDPVSNKEITRNNEIHEFQGNRNPFIDHPEYVEQIWNGAEPSPDPDITTLLFEDFESYSSGSIITIEGWQNYAEYGSVKWVCDDYSQNQYAEMRAYQSNENINESWIVTKSIPLNEYKNGKLSFSVKGGHDNGATLEAYVLTNYSSSDLPWEATKSTISFTLPSVPSDTYMNYWSSSEIIDLSTYTETINIAFKYSGGEGIGKTTTWQIDNLLVVAEKVPSTIPKQFKNTLKISPNPSNGTITIKGDFSNRVININVFSKTGGKIHSEKGVYFEEIELNLSHLPKGFYFLEISAENKQFTTKKVILY